ncbi:hypothetical protein E6O75_ATG01687 [Venturia nashicola]|uniref:Uncharacterized protein n=1 Tax=Venturia nashicola TaxID=86259 RepID=A0A4Z1NGP6_9PEZI|nr:hypothetical protein E6O75_ATG01687 [Venturia nashicola]
MTSSKNTRSRSCKIFAIIASLLIILAIAIPVIVHFAEYNAHTHKKAHASPAKCKVQRLDDHNKTVVFDRCYGGFTSLSGARVDPPKGLFDDVHLIDEWKL